MAFQIPQTKAFASGTSGLTALGGGILHHIIVGSVAGGTVSFYDGSDSTGKLKLNVVVGANATVPVPLGMGIEFDTSVYWQSTAAVLVTVQGEGNLA
jgi:hypothetical protein